MTEFLDALWRRPLIWFLGVLISLFPKPKPREGALTVDAAGFPIDQWDTPHQPLGHYPVPPRTATAR